MAIPKETEYAGYVITLRQGWRFCWIADYCRKGADSEERYYSSSHTKYFEGVGAKAKALEAAKAAIDKRRSVEQGEPLLPS